MRAASALARRTLASGRISTGSFALLFLFIAFVNPVGYRRAYPTAADRLAFAHSFGANKIVQLFYGIPHDLLSVGGFATIDDYVLTIDESSFAQTTDKRSIGLISGPHVDKTYNRHRRLLRPRHRRPHGRAAESRDERAPARSTDEHRISSP